MDVWKKGVISAYGQHGGQLDRLPPNSLFQDDQQRIWVATQSAFGYLENDRFVPLNDVPGGTILSFAEDRAGNIWVANEHLGLFEVRQGHVSQQISWQKLGHKDHASVIAGDRLHGGLWIGFFSGGIAHLVDGQIHESYSSADGLTDGRVSGFQFDTDGAIWISTAGGLNRLKNGRLITMTGKNGLPCDGVNWAMKDNAHSLWLYTPCGLVKIDWIKLNAWISAVEKDNHATPTIQFAVFDSYDGVRSLADTQQRTTAWELDSPLAARLLSDIKGGSGHH